MNLSELLGNFCPPHTLTHGGKLYSFHLIDKAMQAGLEKAYWKHCRDTLALLKDDMSAEEYSAERGRILKEFQRGAYAFPQGESKDWFFGAGLPDLLSHLTGCTLEEAHALIEALPDDVAELAMVVFLESFPNAKTRLIQDAQDGREEGKKVEALFQMFLTRRTRAK